MSTAGSDPARETLRALWRIRNPWDRRLRHIVRELIRSDIRALRIARAQR